MKRFQRCLLWLFLASLMIGCIPFLPIVTVPFDLGKGHSLADMERAEAIAEKLGFERHTVVIDKVRRIRADDEKRYTSSFGIGYGFTIRVNLYKSDGRLEVRFTENTRDDNSSPEGERILQKLNQELRAEFGDQVQQGEKKVIYIFASIKKAFSLACIGWGELANPNVSA
jgi:hypothetical protein